VTLIRKVKATASEGLQVGMAVSLTTDETGAYIAKRTQQIGRPPDATATEDIKAGDRIVFEDGFVRKVVGDEWSKLS
jgi:hypothetical protein